MYVASNHREICDILIFIVVPNVLIMVTSVVHVIEIIGGERKILLALQIENNGCNFDHRENYSIEHDGTC